MLYNSLCPFVQIMTFFGFAANGIIVLFCNFIYHIFVRKSLKHREQSCHLNSLLNGKLCICEISKSKTDITTLIIVNSKYIFLDISVTFNIRINKLCEFFLLVVSLWKWTSNNLFRKQQRYIFVVYLPLF